MSEENPCISIATGTYASTLGGDAALRSIARSIIVIAIAIGTILTHGNAATIPYNVYGLSPAGIGLQTTHRECAYISPPSFTDAKARFTPLYEQRWKYTRVTLLRDTPHVGSKGDVAIVNRNYAFNYLVPFGFARYTTRAELIGIALQKDYKEALLNVRKASAMDLKTRLGANTVLQFQIPGTEAGSNTLVSPILPIHIIDKMREMKLLLAIDMLREQDVEIPSEGGVITHFGIHRVFLKADPDVTIEIAADVKEKEVDTSFIKDLIF